MTTLEYLRAARALIDTPEKWCKNNIGHALDGSPILHAHLLDQGIIGLSHCAFGAIRAVTRSQKIATPANNALSRVAVGTDFHGTPWNGVEWNNAPERTHADILAAFDRAIANEEAKEQEFHVEPLPTEVAA